MTRSRTQTLALVSGIVIAALPVAFGVIRAATTGSDFRYLWTAISALAGAFAVTARRPAANHHNATSLVLALCVATLLAAATAVLVGARSVGAVLAVSLAFGACTALGSGLIARSRILSTGRAGR